VELKDHFFTDQRPLPWLSRHSQDDSYVASRAAAAVAQSRATAIVNVSRVYATVCISFCPCQVESKEAKSCKVVLAPHEHRPAGQHVVARPYLPVRCSVALGQSDRRTKQSIMESALAARVVAQCARQAYKTALTALVRLRIGGSRRLNRGWRLFDDNREYGLAILSLRCGEQKKAESAA
jgi:hypothetical protein